MIRFKIPFQLQIFFLYDFKGPKQLQILCNRIFISDLLLTAASLLIARLWLSTKTPLMEEQFVKVWFGFLLFKLLQLTNRDQDTSENCNNSKINGFLLCGIILASINWITIYCLKCFKCFHLNNQFKIRGGDGSE